jgi:nucleotide-binding universal stress UspA family protein
MDATGNKSRLRIILLADDGSPHSRAAVELIADLPHPPDCIVTALRIFTPLQSTEQAAMEDALMITRSLLANKGLNAKAEFLLGYPSAKILEYADEHKPDLVVIGAKGLRNAFGIPLGGVAMHLLEDGRFPVLIVRAPYKGLKKILLVVDGSSCSDVACGYLGNFPLPESAEVIVMHVVPPLLSPVIVEPFPGGVIMPPIVSSVAEEDEERRLAADREGMLVVKKAAESLTVHGIHAIAQLGRGDAAEEIINYARKQSIDLIVAGSHGFGAVRGWLMGSVSRKIAHYSGCSVLIARCVLPVE